MQEASDKNIENLLAGGGFSSLLQNPEIASKLPRIMEALAPVMAEMKAEKSEASGSVKPSAEDAADGVESAAAQTPPGEKQGVPDVASLAAGLLSSGGGGGKHTHPGLSRRCALLNALKPYLSDGRKEALDYSVKVSTLIDLLSEVI